MAASCSSLSRTGLTGPSPTADLGQERPDSLDQSIHPLCSTIKFINRSQAIARPFAADGQRSDTGILHDHPDPCAELRNKIVGIVVHGNTTPGLSQEVQTQRCRVRFHWTSPPTEALVCSQNRGRSNWPQP